MGRHARLDSWEEVIEAAGEVEPLPVYRPICPTCGRPPTPPLWSHWWIWAYGVFVLIFIIGIGMGVATNG